MSNISQTNTNRSNTTTSQANSSNSNSRESQYNGGQSLSTHAHSVIASDSVTIGNYAERQQTSGMRNAILGQTAGFRIIDFVNKLRLIKSMYKDFLARNPKYTKNLDQGKNSLPEAFIDEVIEAGVITDKDLFAFGKGKKVNNEMIRGGVAQIISKAIDPKTHHALLNAVENNARARIYINEQREKTFIDILAWMIDIFSKEEVTRYTKNS